MSTHNLKIQRQPFEDLVSGRKTGEVRNCADREFREGDHVELFLIDETGNPANKSIVRTITHIQRGYGLPDDICVLSYAAPVVERQPVAWMYHERSEDGYEYRPLFSRQKWVVLPDGFYEESPLYTAPPELAELQATIAQLETKLNNAINLDFERRAEIERLAKNSAEWEAASLHWMAERDQCKSEIERLKGGQASVQTLADKCDNCEKITLGLSGSTKWCAYCGARLTGETVHVSQPTPTQGK